MLIDCEDDENQIYIPPKNLPVIWSVSRATCCKVNIPGNIANRMREFAFKPVIQYSLVLLVTWRRSSSS